VAKKRHRIILETGVFEESATDKYDHFLRGARTALQAELGMIKILNDDLKAKTGEIPPVPYFVKNARLMRTAQTHEISAGYFSQADFKDLMIVQMKKALDVWEIIAHPSSNAGGMTERALEHIYILNEVLFEEGHNKSVNPLYFPLSFTVTALNKRPIA
jgi:hypothetical protein